MFKNVISGPRRSGKSTALMKLVVDAAKNDYERILVVAHNHSTREYLHNLCMQLLSEDIIRYVRVPLGSIELKNGHTIYFISGDKNPIKGQAVDFIAIDEHTLVSDEFKEAILPCVGRYGRVWMTEYDKTGTPNGEYTHEQLCGTVDV